MRLSVCLSPDQKNIDLKINEVDQSGSRYNKTDQSGFRYNKTDQSGSRYNKIDQSRSRCNKTDQSDSRTPKIDQSDEGTLKLIHQEFLVSFSKFSIQFFGPKQGQTRERAIFYKV